MLVLEDRKCKFRDEDWVCTDPLCGNVNYQWRKSCNKCHKSKDEHVPPIIKVIGKSAAEKSEGIFKAQDWQCKGCGNVNWARRQTCNRCDKSKFDPLNVIGPDEIIEDEEDDKMSVHSSSLSSPPSGDSDSTDSGDSGDSGIVGCEEIKKEDYTVVMRKYMEKLLAGVLNVSKEDLLKESTSFDPNKCRTAMLVIMHRALCVNEGGDIDLSEAGQQAIMEDLKSFVLNSGLFTPAQKTAALQMSVPEMMKMYCSLMSAQMKPKTRSEANSNSENLPAVHNPMSEPPSRPEHHCHGTDRVSHEMKCCGAMPSTSYDSHHCDCGSQKSYEKRCCDRRPVSCCNNHCCDKSTLEKHLCNSGSTCCDRSRNENRPPPHVGLNHERRRSLSCGSNHWEKSNVSVKPQEERRVVLLSGYRSRSNSKSPPKERRKILFYGRRTPTPPLPPPHHRRNRSPGPSSARHPVYNRFNPRREARERMRSEREREYDPYRRYSPNRRHSRSNGYK